MEKKYLHGEMVALGVMTELVIENRFDECRELAEFFTTVGLPICWKQMGIDLDCKDQVETMLVSPICTVTADYTECLLGEPDSEDGYYLTRPESLLGGQVVRKNFASLYTDPFRTVTDRKAIARTLAGVQPGADQMERLKQAKQGYAVSLITKDGKATKMYFVPTAYGYAQGKPTTDTASDLAYARG